AMWDKMRSASPVPPSIPYPHGYFPQSPYNDRLNSYQSYDNYATHTQDTKTMVDVTDFWNRKCASSASRPYLPSYQFSSPPSPYPGNTIQVQSDAEFQRVLSNLTNNHIPRPLLSY